MKVDMNLLKQLRDMTLASLQDCSKALVEANGDLDVAHDILKKSGALKAAKKADRETNEGVIKLLQKDGRQAGVKVLCETDFVAKNDSFQQLVDTLLDTILASSKTFSSLEDADVSLVDQLQQMVTQAIVSVGENLRLADAFCSTEQAYVYNHPGNKVASIIYYTGNDDQAAKEVALQVAAMNPSYLSIDEVPQGEKDQVIAGEREALIASGKPADMVDKILEGKLQKALSEYVLLEQESIRDAAKKVKELLPAGFQIHKFERYSI